MHIESFPPAVLCDVVELKTVLFQYVVSVAPCPSFHTGSGLVSEGLDSGLSRSRVTGSGTISLTLRDACTCAVSCRLVAHEFQSLMSRQVINPSSVQTGECAALEATSQEQSISVLHLWKKHWSLSVF